MSRVLRGFAWLVICAGSAISSIAAQDVSRDSPDLLPASTRAWISVPDWQVLTDHFNASGFGRLSQDESMKAFADSLKSQVESWLNERNFRLGITVDDVRNLRSGEICLAGVLPGADDPAGPVTRGQHGIVLLVDIRSAEDRAAELLQKVERELLARGATAESIDPVQGIAVRKFRLPVRNGGTARNSLHGLADGWLLASDNEQIFREVIRRIRNPELKGTLGCLRDDAAFQAVRRESAIEGVTEDLAWFIEPFGYVQLAQAIADEEAPLARRRNDVAAKLKAQGFDVFRAVGGTLAFSQLDHDFIHRTALHAPQDAQTRPEQKRALQLVSLENKWNLDLGPEPFAPAEANSYATLAVDIMSARRNFGPIFDEFAETGAFDRMVNGWNKDLGIDLDALLGTLGNRISIWSTTDRPVSERSERVGFAIPCSGAAGPTLDAIRKLFGPTCKPKEREGLRFLMVENEEVAVEELEIDDPRFLDPDDEDKSGDDEGLRAFNLFEKLYITVARGHIVVANQEDFLFRLAVQETRTPGLADTRDFQAVSEALSRLSDPGRVCAREFGRIDQILEVNYEMLRQDKMVGSQTTLARLLNWMFQSGEDPNAPRQRRIDGTSLPADYQQAVAPYLGPSGWVIEKTGDGWLMSGCILRKAGRGEPSVRADSVQ